MARRAGYDVTCRALAALRRGAAASGSERARLVSLFARVHGRPPRPEELAAVAAESARVNAEVEATLLTMDAAAAARSGERIDLPALTEIERARAAGKGVVLGALHYGNYTLALMGLGAKVPLTVIVLDGPGYAWMEECGFKVVGLGAAALECMRALRRNEAVWVFCDLDFFPEGRLEPFLGAPIRPPHALARLAQAAGAPVVPVYCEAAEGGRWRLEGEPPLEGNLERAMLDSMERRVRRRPEHWVIDLDVWNVEEADRVNRRRLLGASSPRSTGR